MQLQTSATKSLKKKKDAKRGKPLLNAGVLLAPYTDRQ